VLTDTTVVVVAFTRSVSQWLRSSLAFTGVIMAGNATGSKAAEKLKNVDHVILVGVQRADCLPASPQSS